MATQEERGICTAPPGKFQIIHIDPRDHWPTREGAPSTLEEVRGALDRMTSPQREVMQVFDDKGKRIPL